MTRSVVAWIGGLGVLTAILAATNQPAVQPVRAAATPYSETICNPVCAVATMNPTEVAEVDSRVAATATPVPRPILALNANAGSGASISFVAGSSLTAGGISWTAGPSPAAGTQFVVTFPSAFPVVPAAPCVAANRSAAHINLYSIPTTTTVTVGSDVAPTNGTTYVCQYAVVLP